MTNISGLTVAGAIEEAERIGKMDTRDIAPQIQQTLLLLAIAKAVSAKPEPFVLAGDGDAWKPKGSCDQQWEGRTLTAGVPGGWCVHEFGHNGLHKDEEGHRWYGSY